MFSFGEDVRWLGFELVNDPAEQDEGLSRGEVCENLPKAT